MPSSEEGRRIGFWRRRTPIFLLVLLVVNVAAFHFSRSRSSFRGPMLEEGEVLASVAVEDVVTRERGNLPDKRSLLTVLMYFNNLSAGNLQKAIYADLVATKYLGLEAVAVTHAPHGAFPELIELKRRGKITLPLLVDEDSRIARSLGVPADRDGFFVIDDQGRILFASKTGFFLEDDVRQFAEKYLVGSIAYPDVAQETIGVGDPFPLVSVENATTGVSVEGPELFENRIMVVFTAECTGCAFVSYLDTYKGLEKDLLREDPRHILLFSSRFRGALLKQLVGEHNIRADILVAEDELTGFEDLYFNKISFGSTPLIVRTDERRRITSIKPLTPQIIEGKTR